MLFFITLCLFFCFPINASQVSASQGSSEKIIYFIQGHWGNFFDPKSAIPMRQAGYDLEPMYRLNKVAKEAGYDLRIANRDTLELTDILGRPLEVVEKIIVFDVFMHQLDYLKHYPKEKLVLILWEPPSVIPESYVKQNHKIFSKVYTWRDDFTDNKKYFKFHYPVLHPMVLPTVAFDAKKLCTLIASNRYSPHPDELYSERSRVANFYEANHPEDFDLYGRGWQPSFKTYKGLIDIKSDVLRGYKFNIAYENIKDIPGYITEKIFDAFQAGSVPVYWGASNIEEYIPKGCFIRRQDFASDEELYQFMKNMKEESYDLYIENIQKFLSSEKAQAYSADRFVNTLMELIKS